MSVQPKFRTDAEDALVAQYAQIRVQDKNRQIKHQREAQSRATFVRTVKVIGSVLAICLVWQPVVKPTLALLATVF